jgi:hypothetical protein
MTPLDRLSNAIVTRFGAEHIVALYKYGKHELPASRSHESHYLVILDQPPVMTGRLKLPILSQIHSLQVFTEPELQRATDVFALEFSDMKWGRDLLMGRDVLETIELSAANARQEAEFYTRSVVLKLRSALLLSPKDVVNAIGLSVSDIIRSLRGVLNSSDPVRAVTPLEVIYGIEAWLKTELPQLRLAVETKSLRQVTPVLFLNEVTLIAENIDRI